MALVVLVAACSPAEPVGTSTTFGSTVTTVTTVTTPTTNVVDTTTSAPSTTTAPGEVTLDPYLPSAQSRSAISWSEVGAGWYVVLYDSTKANPSGPEDERDGPKVLYLVDPAGSLFELASWDPEIWVDLADATATAAVVMTRTQQSDVDTYSRIDLTTGQSTVVRTVDFSESSLLPSWMLTSLTRPTGDNLLMHRAEGGREWLERQAPNGSVLSVVYERILHEDQSELSWLYSPDGTYVVIGDSDTLEMVAIDGTPRGELWSPTDTECRPVRWWDAGTFLARCHQTNVDTALVDETGEPHLYYGWLLLIPTDGSPGSSLTSIPTKPTTVVDFGYQDAWPAGGDVLLQWTGDCGAAEVRTLNSDGLGDSIQIDWPDELALGYSSTLLEAHNEIMTLLTWEGCGGSVGMLHTVDIEGQNLQTLVPVIGDARGVTYAVPLRTVYP